MPKAYMEACFILYAILTLLKSEDSGVRKKLSYETRVAEPLVGARCISITELHQSFALQEVCCYLFDSF